MTNHLDTLLTQSLEALTTAASGDSLCTLKGLSVEAAKYYEGRVVAIKKLQRLVTARDNAEVRAELDGFATRWRDALPQNYLDHPAWRSYAEGGADVVEEVQRFSGK